MSDIERGKAMLEKLLTDDVIQIRPSDRERFMDEWCEAMGLIEQAARQAPASGEVEPSGVWQFYQDGEWHVGMNTHNHRKNTEDAGFPTRDLYTHPPAKVPEGWKEAALGAKRFADDPKMVLMQPQTAEAHIRGLADLILTTPTPATTPQPESGGRIKLSERVPTGADADDLKQVWFCRDPYSDFGTAFGLSLHMYYAVAENAEKYLQYWPHAYWAPTGLKRPQPPQEQ